MAQVGGSPDPASRTGTPSAATAPDNPESVAPDPATPEPITADLPVATEAPVPVPADSSGSASTSERAALRIRAVRGFAWAAVSFGGNKLLVFLSTLVLTRLLAPADFGVVAAGLTVIAYLEVTLDLGLSAAIVYRQDKGHPKAISVAFTLNILTCSVLAALNLLAAPLVADFFRVPDSANVFRALSLYILIRGVGALQDALLKRDLRFREKAAADVTRALIRGGLGVALALAGTGVWALIWSFIVSELAGTAVAISKTRYRPRFVVDLRETRSLLRYGMPVAALQLLSELGINADYLVVGHVLGSVALGLYTIAFRLPELMLANVFWIFSSVAFPVFSSSRTHGTDLFQASMLRALRLITLFGFPVSVGLALVSRDAVTVLFGPEWVDAGTPMALISLAIGLGAVGYASGDIFKAAGKPGTLLWVNLIGTVVSVTAFVVAAPSGITTVAAVHLGYNFLYGLVRLALANRLVGTTARQTGTAMVPALAVSAAVALAALPVRLLLDPGVVALLAVIAAGVVGAALGLVLTGRETVREVRSLGSALARRAS